MFVPLCRIGFGAPKYSISMAWVFKPEGPCLLTIEAFQKIMGLLVPIL